MGLDSGAIGNAEIKAQVRNWQALPVSNSHAPIVYRLVSRFFTPQDGVQLPVGVLHRKNAIQLRVL